MMNRVHLTWSGAELTTLVVIGTDSTDDWKSNYHTITTTTAPRKRSYDENWKSVNMYAVCHTTNLENAYLRKIPLNHGCASPCHHYIEDKLRSPMQWCLKCFASIKVRKNIWPGSYISQLKYTASSVCKLLQKLFTFSIRLAVFPDNWKTALVLLSYKNRAKQLPTNYRPFMETAPFR